MEPQRLTGPEAGVLKYDLLTALSVAGLNGSPTLQTSLMRLIALVTARYNWREDEFSVGQRDMARMWSVNERTVKREVKRLVETGVLICKRSGVRGRVGAYRLNYGRIAEMSRPCWPLVGPDFDARMQTRYADRTGTVVHLSTYAAPPEPCDPARPGTWERAMAQIAQEHPDLYKAWFARVAFVGFEKGLLRLKTPSRFIQRYIETHHMPLLLRAVEHELGPVDQVTFLPA